MPEDIEYTEEDLEASLRRAFVDRDFESILMDGHQARNEFLRDGVNHGLNQGWLKKKEEFGDSQYTAIKYTLTDKGKTHFGLETNSSA